MTARKVEGGVMSAFDKAFCRWLSKECNRSPDVIFVKLVECIGFGNGQYICELCAELGCPNDMLKASQLIAQDLA